MLYVDNGFNSRPTQAPNGNVQATTLLLLLNLSSFSLIFDGKSRIKTIYFMEVFHQ